MHIAHTTTQCIRLVCYHRRCVNIVLTQKNINAVGMVFWGNESPR